MKRRAEFLTFGRPVIGEAEIKEVVDTLTSGWLGTGPKVARFEDAFRIYKQAEFVAALNSCSAALHLSMVAVNIAPGDEVITTAMTFCATVNAIMHAKGTPVLADVDPISMNMDPDDVERRITSRTRAIIPVHFGGRPCEMDRIMAVARRHNLKVIEDCAHAVETEFHGKRAGTFGDFGCFSFYATKSVVTGEGGMVTAHNPEDIARIKTLALHGLSADAWRRYSEPGHKHYLITECGFKYNMTDLQAALGIHQLARVEDNWMRREQIWQRYQTAFEDLPVKRPADAARNTRHAYHLYTLRVDEEHSGISRDRFVQEMIDRNIGVGVHYLAIPEHPYYAQSFDWDVDAFPNARDIGRTTVSLPLAANLSDDDVADVIAAVTDVLSDPIAGTCGKGEKPFERDNCASTATRQTSQWPDLIGRLRSDA